MATILHGKFPIITLKNGITVVNYGSNHEYTFNTDEVLGACSDEVCNATKLIPDHTGTARVIIDNAGSRFSVNIPDDKLDHWEGYVLQNHPAYDGCKMWLDVFINYQISSDIEDDITRLAEMDMVNIILVPYPVMNAWEYETKIQREIVDQLGNDALVKFTDVWQFALLKMRTCHLKDRVTKIIYSDRFCSSSEALQSNEERKALTLVRNGD